MAERVELFTVSVPAGTLSTAPISQSLSFNEGIVRKIGIRIPPGPSGLSGFRIGHSRQIVIPDDGVTWLVTDDEVIDWDLSGYPTGRAWYIEAYNTGKYSHNIYLRFLVDEIASRSATYPPPLALG